MPMPKKRGYSWPFNFRLAATKTILKKMQFWVATRDDAICLPRSDYDELMKSLPKDFIRIGTPKFEGRDVLKMGGTK